MGSSSDCVRHLEALLNHAAPLAGDAVAVSGNPLPRCAALLSLQAGIVKATRPKP